MTATPATVTIETFIGATAQYVKTRQTRYATQGADAMLQLIKSGDFDHQYLTALAEGIRLGMTYRV